MGKADRNKTDPKWRKIICILLSLPFPERKTPKNKSIRYFILEKTLFEYYL